MNFELNLWGKSVRSVKKSPCHGLFGRRDFCIITIFYFFYLVLLLFYILIFDL